MQDYSLAIAEEAAVESLLSDLQTSDEGKEHMAASPLDEAAFKEFIAQRKADLERIRRSTRKEHELSDVENEAWLMAHQLKAKKAVKINFSDKSFQDLLISYLYQHLIRYTEQNIRHATRFDHAIDGDDSDGDLHPLMRTLTSDDGQHPLTVLIEQEETSTRLFEINLSHSLAGAYVRLLHHFDNKMPAVARHLLISLSYAYRRCAYARLLANCQKSIPSPMMDETFIPGPWRRFRLQRIPTQLAFEFDEELPLEPLPPAPVGIAGDRLQ